MNIYYESKSASWFHTGMKDEITIGGDNQIVRHQRASMDATRFDLQLKNGHVGPLIGIMTSRKENGSWAGNYSLFKELQKKLISLHGISFIFTQEGIQDESINGFTYLPESQTWMKIKAPYPDLVYNRIPFRKAEQNEDFHHTLDIFKQKDIPFFNPCFIDKYDIHQLFKHHPILQKFLPKTEIIDNQTDVESFLEKYQSVYVKPAQSAKGKGIIRLRLNDQSEVHLDGISTNEEFASFQAFWNKWGSILNSKRYIIQEEIHSALYNGNRFDFRILAHAEKNMYHVTGIGIRQSQKQDVTTHIPNGGELLSYNLIRSTKHDQFIKKIVHHIGKTLTEKFGFFGEFSIDAGISLSGNYYIYEVNSKPMSFDEEEIEQKRMKQLCRLFLTLTNFA
jgi:hypothetical protein